ncbi:MAG: hypothetical protein RR482_06770, partial [Clostridia bacterium]
SYFAGQNKPTPTPFPTYSPATFSGYAMLTANGVRFRQTPNGASMYNLQQGTVLRLISEAEAGGYGWYQAETGGKTGYIRNDMVRLLSVSEYQQLQQAPSYTDNNQQIITPTLRPNTTNRLDIPAWTTPSVSARPTFVTIAPVGTQMPLPTPTPWSTNTPTPTFTLTPSPSPSLIPAPAPTYPTKPSQSFHPPALLLALAVLLILLSAGLYGFSLYNRARKKQAVQDDILRTTTTPRKPPATSDERPAIRRQDPPATLQRPTVPVPPAANRTATERPANAVPPRPATQLRAPSPETSAAPHERLPQQPVQAPHREDDAPIGRHARKPTPPDSKQ